MLVWTIDLTGETLSLLAELWWTRRRRRAKSQVIGMSPLVLCVLCSWLVKVGGCSRERVSPQIINIRRTVKSWKAARFNEVLWAVGRIRMA